MTKEEHDLIEKEIFENFYSHAISFNKLSTNELNEMELNATLKGDAEMNYILDLARDLNAQIILNSGL